MKKHGSKPEQAVLMRYPHICGTVDAVQRQPTLHSSKGGIGIFDEPSAEQEDKSALMKKFLESVSHWDDYTTASRYGWIEEVDDPSIYKQLQALRKADLELLTLIVVDGFSQTEIAAVLGYTST